LGRFLTTANGSDSGHVRIYAWNSATSAWEQQGADIDGEAAYDNSGQSVSLSSDGTTVAIGAPWNDDNGSNSGHVRIYAWNSTTSAWEQQGADIDGEAENDQSGRSVSLSSTARPLPIGAPYNDGNGSGSGHVRIYAWNSATSAWEQQGADIDGEGRRIIAAVAFHFPPTARPLPLGRKVTTATGSDSGHVRIYAWNSATSAWEQQGADIDGEAADDQSGWERFTFLRRHDQLLLGRIRTTATALTPVTFVFTHGIVLQVLGNSKAPTSTAKQRMIGAAERFSFLRRHDSCYWGVFNNGNGTLSGHVRIYWWH
jgi:hypothetical protein